MEQTLRQKCFFLSSNRIFLEQKNSKPRKYYMNLVLRFMALSMSGVSLPKLDRVAPLIPDPPFATPPFYKMFTLSQTYTFHEGLFTCYVSNQRGKRGAPDFEGTLCRRQMRELQSQGIHPLLLSCKGLMKVRIKYGALWILLGQFEQISRVELCGSPEIKMCSKWHLQRVLSAIRNKRGLEDAGSP